MLRRLLAKFNRVMKYPRLGQAWADRRELLLLGLAKEYLISPATAARWSKSRSTVLVAALQRTKAQKVRVDVSNRAQIDSFDEIFLGPIYPLEEVSFIPDLIVDCGGFCGYFSALAAARFPKCRIVCFEANPDQGAVLEAQFSLLSSDVELQNTGVALHDEGAWYRGSGVGGQVTMESSGGSVKIPTVDFPGWLAAQSIRRILLKLDIEGAEKALLPAILPLLPLKTAIFLETHHSNEVVACLLNSYRDAGFRVREIRRRPALEASFDFVEWVLVRGQDASGPS